MEANPRADIKENLAGAIGVWIAFFKGWKSFGGSLAGKCFSKMEVFE